jgi:hypothetical protein
MQNISSITDYASTLYKNSNLEQQKQNGTSTFSNYLERIKVDEKRQNQLQN